MNPKIADNSVTNSDGSHWKAEKQLFTGRGRAFKLSFSNISGVDYYAWVFDAAAGDATSTTPVYVMLVPSNFAATWDLGTSGGLFMNGCYVGLRTAAPTSFTDAGTASGDDKMIVKGDIRIG